jgi:phenylacetate-CoA ligase
MTSLYPALFQRVVFPALDLLNRTRVSNTYRALRRSQWWSAEEHAREQERKLARILAWSEAQSSFYREHWRSAPAERRAASIWPALDGLPIVTKQDLRVASDSFPLAGHGGRVLRVRTSGSTGEPMTFYRSGEQESWFWALRLRMWEWGGYVPGEPYLTLNLNPRIALRKRLQDVLFRCRYHGFNANEHDVDRVVRDLRDGRIPHLIGYASSLHLLATELERRGETVAGVRSILSTGDTLHPAYRSRIEAAFGSGVTDYYGAGGEGLHLASQCEQRGRYHLHPENACVEIVTDGRPARPGETGEIVVTQLDNLAMPLVRYATADAAVATAETACACGRKLPLIEGVVGRVSDCVRAPDGSVLVVHFFTILFEHLDGVDQFQVVQRESDRVVARLVPGPGLDRPAVEASVREALSAASHGTLAVDFEYPASIPPAPSLKRRLVVCELDG